MLRCIGCSFQYCLYEWANTLSRTGNHTETLNARLGGLFYDRCHISTDPFSNADLQHVPSSKYVYLVPINYVLPCNLRLCQRTLHCSKCTSSVQQYIAMIYISHLMKAMTEAPKGTKDFVCVHAEISWATTLVSNCFVFDLLFLFCCAASPAYPSDRAHRLTRLAFHLSSYRRLLTCLYLLAFA